MPKKESKNNDPVSSLLDPPKLFVIQSIAKDMKDSSENLDKKQQYIGDLNNEIEHLKLDKDPCVKNIIETEDQINQTNNKLQNLLTQKEKLEKEIEDNQLKMNNFINQKNVKEREPINTVHKIENELSDLKFKVDKIPKIKTEIDSKTAQIAKILAEIERLKAKSEEEKTNSANFKSQIDSLKTEQNNLRRNIEGLKVKLAMRKMKLDLANSNFKIKEYLMSLIKTNNGKDTDFDSLVSGSEKARNEIRGILKEFIRQSNGIDSEISVSDGQLEEMIEKDQKEFEEIKKIYGELVNIIGQYGDFEIYTRAITQEIQDCEKRLAAEERQFSEIRSKIIKLENELTKSQERISSYFQEIENLEEMLRQLRKFVSEKTAENEQNEKEYDDLVQKRDNYLGQHKVN